MVASHRCFFCFTLMQDSPLSAGASSQVSASEQEQQAENTEMKAFKCCNDITRVSACSEDLRTILNWVSYSYTLMICTFSWGKTSQKWEIWLGCFFRSNWKKTHGWFSSGLCWKDYASHLAWEHLWIPQEELEHAARKREAQMPVWAWPDERWAEDDGSVNTLTVSASDREMWRHRV